MTSPGLRVARVRVERRNDLALADAPTPRLSWTVQSVARGWWQRSAEVRLDGEALAVIDGDQSAFVGWPFPPIQPHTSHTIEVRVTGRDGVTSPWSRPVVVQAGFLADGEWRAAFIGLASPLAGAAPGLLRTEFELDRPVAFAALYATAHGAYQVELNGQDVDDAVLKPGWTSYPYRLVHEATDVTGLLVPDRNAIGVRLAGGWWTEQYGFGGFARRIYGDQPNAALQLHLRFADGTTQVVTTGPDWRGLQGPTLSSSIYQGEWIDARRRLPGWSKAGFDDSTWSVVRVVPSRDVPEPQLAEPVRRTEEVAVQQVITTPSGATVLDFGQNLVGRLRVRVRGPAGHVVTLRHAEVLEHGELGTRPLRYASATDHLVLSGQADVFEPEFTFHGFRYAEVTNWPGEFDPAAITAIVIGSDLRRTGWFECSDQLLNRLHENAVWGMRGNFVSLPTDCPQRDERLGWTGDIVAFASTACYLFDSDAFLASWLRDVAAEQAAREGICPVVVPQVLPDMDFVAAGWGDAAVVVPWELFRRYGDRRALDEQYPSMRAWAEALLRIAGDRLLWEGGFQFGDWLDPTAPPHDPGAAKADPDVIAGAYLFRSVDIVARAAAALDHSEDAARYRELAEQVRTAWLREYTTAAGRVVSDAQTVYALAIRFGLAEEPLRAAMGRRLAWLVRRRGYRIGTGFLGTPHVQDALTSTGHEDTARRLLFQTRLPSWLYPVTMGATTIWERWDSMLPDGSINPGEMTSFNHYSVGAVADWLHRVVAGLAPQAPGYRQIRIAPVPLVGLDRAATRHQTPYGEAAVEWQAHDGLITVRATVPANTTATVQLPGSAETEVGSGSHTWTIPDPRPVFRPGPLTLRTPLGALLDDEEAHVAVLDAVQRVDPQRGVRLRELTEWVDTRSLSDEFLVATPVVLDAVAATLEELNLRRAAEIAP